MHVAERLLGCTETRRVGYGSIEHTDHGKKALARHEVYGVGCHAAQQHNGRGQHVVGDAALAERAEEAGADLQTDAVDEEDEAELLHEVRRRGVEHHAEVSAGNAGKKDPCHAKRDAPYLDARQE